MRYGVKAQLLPPNHISQLAGSGYVRLEGLVSSDPVFDGVRTRFKLRAEQLHLQGKEFPTSGGILVKANIPSGLLQYGDRVELRGWLSEPPTAANLGQFNYRHYLHQHGIDKLMSIRNPSQVRFLGKGGNPIRLHGFSPMRRAILASIDSHLRGDPAHLLKGIILGERQALSKRVQKAFSDAGVIHVLAISGLHVGLVITIFFTLFRSMRLGFRLSSLATILMLGAYSGIAQFRPSVVRSSIMGALILFGLCLQRKPNPLNSIGAAGLLILISNPLAIFDLGFQLSFVATISILWLYPKLKELLPQTLWRGGRLKGWLGGSLLVSLSVQLGIAPFLIYHFHRLPLISPLSNLLVVPLVGISLALGLAGSALSLISPHLGYTLAAANWLFLKLTLWLTGLLSQIPYSSISLPSPSPLLTGFYYLCLIPLAHLKSSLLARKWLLISILGLANLLCWKGVLKGEGELKLTFLSVGKGSSTVIQVPRGGTILIDGGGERRGYNFGERVVIPYLQSIGKRSIDLLIVANPDQANLASLLPILSEYRPKAVIGPPTTSLSYLRFTQMVREMDIPYLDLQKGVSLDLAPGVKIELLPSSLGIAFSLKYKMVSFLLGGEIKQPIEHQPSPTIILETTNPARLPNSFLEEVKPRFIIAPSLSPEEREALRELRISPLDLRQTGAITISSDGEKFSIRKYLTKEKEFYNM